MTTSAPIPEPGDDEENDPRIAETARQIAAEEPLDEATIGEILEEAEWRGKATLRRLKAVSEIVREHSSDPHHPLDVADADT